MNRAPHHFTRSTPTMPVRLGRPRAPGGALVATRLSTAVTAGPARAHVEPAPATAVKGRGGAPGPSGLLVAARRPATSVA
ncbi:hypothetical protein [Saccharothrix xinjiangensis]|uniref:Uncharacterized protein n=1 Tax=Saccharothrix xinjiangensis TaxID=204798 RepID=A0ABV9Y1V7_9PSEU